MYVYGVGMYYTYVRILCSRCYVYCRCLYDVCMCVCMLVYALRVVYVTRVFVYICLFCSVRNVCMFARYVLYALLRTRVMCVFRICYARMYVRMEVSL